VDPFLNWMEKIGYVPLEKTSPAWVKDIRNHAYLNVGDFEGLEQLAKRVDPHKTFLGKNGDYRKYAFDVGYPDYEPTALAKRWFRRARDLGFHVGAHFNSMCISRMFPDLVERMRPGFRVTGKGAHNNATYEAIYEDQLIYCSAAYKPFRDLLIERMRPAVE